MSTLTERKFSDYCDKYASSKLILSTQPLQDLLKFIAGDREIFAVIENCAKDFNFKEEFECAQITTSTGSILRLPNSKKTLIAFVTTLLYSFDSGNINLLDFLEKFYHAEEGVKQSFPLMCKAMVIPYKNAVISALRGEREEEEGQEIEEVTEKLPQIPDGAVAQGGRALRAFAKTILEDGSLTSQEKNDYLAVADGALHALEIRNTKLVKSFFVALKYIAEDIKGGQSRLKDFESALKLYFVL